MSIDGQCFCSIVKSRRVVVGEDNELSRTETTGNGCTDASSPGDYKDLAVVTRQHNWRLMGADTFGNPPFANVDEPSDRSKSASELAFQDLA
jgi:hypothetical protein